MQDEFAKAETLQQELAARVADVAAILAQPYSRRDPGDLRDAWAEVQRFHTRINTMRRQLNRLDRNGTRLERRGSAVVPRGTRPYMRDFSARLQNWNAIMAMVERHLAPQQVPLLQERRDRHKDKLADFLYLALHRAANTHTQDDDAHELGCFADIPMPLREFESMMRAAYRVLNVLGRRQGQRFLDVGCGGGSKVLLASRYFAACDGLDYDPGYADAAARLLKSAQATGCTAFQADGITFDGYGNYDVIYFYRPLRENEILAKMEDQIFANARPGTIVIAPYDTYFNPRRMFCAQITKCIFITGMSQADADQLRIDAEHTDPELVSRAADLKFDTGFWTPVLDVTSFNPPEESPLSALREDS